MAADTVIESAKQEANNKAIAKARRDRAQKRRKNDSQSGQTDTSPPSSPLHVTKRRKRHSFLRVSDEEDEEYILSEDTDTEQSSTIDNDTSDVSSAPEKGASPKHRRQTLRNRKSSTKIIPKGSKASTKLGKDNEDINSSCPPPVPSKTCRKKSLNKSRTLHAKSQTTPTKLTLSDSPVAKTFGPLLTPPPHHFSPTIPVSPISLVSSPKTIIQTHSHTISGIELLPTGSDTHIATVDGNQTDVTLGLVPIPEATPPETPRLNNTEKVKGQEEDKKEGYKL